MEFTIENNVTSNDLELGIEELEPIVAPGSNVNHNETLVSDCA